MIAAPLAMISSADAVTDDSDSTTWVNESVPGTPFTLRRPAHWVVNPPSTNQLDSASPGDIRLVIANPENGDSVIVNRFVGKNGQWYPHFTDFEQAARLSAEQSEGKLLATGRRELKGTPVYWSLETFEDVNAGVPVYYVEFESPDTRKSVVTFAMNINRDTPHARRLITNLIKNIRAK